MASGPLSPDSSEHRPIGESAPIRANELGRSESAHTATDGVAGASARDSLEFQTEDTSIRQERGAATTDRNTMHPIEDLHTIKLAKTTQAAAVKAKVFKWSKSARAKLKDLAKMISSVMKDNIPKQQPRVSNPSTTLGKADDLYSSLPLLDRFVDDASTESYGTAVSTTNEGLDSSAPLANSSVDDENPHDSAPLADKFINPDELYSAHPAANDDSDSLYNSAPLADKFISPEPASPSSESDSIDSFRTAVSNADDSTADLGYDVPDAGTDYGRVDLTNVPAYVDDLEAQPGSTDVASIGRKFVRLDPKGARHLGAGAFGSVMRVQVAADGALANLQAATKEVLILPNIKYISENREVLMLVAEHLGYSELDEILQSNDSIDIARLPREHWEKLVELKRVVELAKVNGPEARSQVAEGLIALREEMQEHQQVDELLKLHTPESRASLQPKREAAERLFAATEGMDQEELAAWLGSDEAKGHEQDILDTYRFAEGVTGTAVAVKTLTQANAETTSQVVKEVAFSQRPANNPHVLRSLLGTLGDQMVVVCPLCDGGDVDALVADDGLSDEDLLGLLTDVTDGLVALSDAGVVHRDIRTPNILVKNTTDESGQPRRQFVIADFGVSTEAGSVRGLRERLPLRWLSPNPVSTDTNDVWSLATMLRRVIIGEKLPYQSTLPESDQRSIANQIFAGNLSPADGLDVLVLQDPDASPMQKAVAQLIIKMVGDPPMNAKQLQAELQKLGEVPIDPEATTKPMNTPNPDSDSTPKSTAYSEPGAPLSSGVRDGTVDAAVYAGADAPLFDDDDGTYSTVATTASPYDGVESTELSRSALEPARFTGLSIVDEEDLYIEPA